MAKPYNNGVPTAAVAVVPAAGQTPAANAAATWTLAAPAAGVAWHLAEIRWSYDGIPTAGTITVTFGTVVETYYVTAAGPGVIGFDPPLRMPAAAGGTVVLAAGGSGVKGAIFGSAWQE